MCLCNNSIMHPYLLLLVVVLPQVQLLLALCQASASKQTGVWCWARQHWTSGQAGSQSTHRQVRKPAPPSSTAGVGMCVVLSKACQNSRMSRA
jgi:hypothetical protein